MYFFHKKTGLYHVGNPEAMYTANGGIGEKKSMNRSSCREQLSLTHGFKSLKGDCFWRRRNKEYVFYSIRGKIVSSLAVAR